MPSMLFRAALYVTAALWAPAAAHAGQEEVHAGFQRFYQGERQAAMADFKKLVDANPAALPARFGYLYVLEDLTDGNAANQAEFEKLIDAFLADADARYDRSDKDDEALFYLASGYLLRATYRFDHDKGMWGAARDGARSKRFSDTYVRRHPEHGDAYFVLGAYNYYVEIAPAFIKLIRPLLFLPSGNRVEGLKQLERAYTQGNIFSYRAGQLLMEIYGTFEGRVADGVRVGEQLAQKYPENPQVQFELAELYGGAVVEDHAKAAAQYEKVIASETARAEVRKSAPRPALYRAQLGLSSAYASQWRFDESIRMLSAAIEKNPPIPAGAMPGLLLRRGNYRGLVMDPAAGEDAQRVLAEPKWKDQHKNAESLLQWINARKASGEGAIYAALVRGNRLTYERKWDEAAAAYDRVRREHPGDPQVRYRLAQLQFARGDADGASVIAGTLAADKKAPMWIRAQSLLMVGRAHDLAGRRDAAKQTYNKVVDDFEKESAVWPARVGLITPYRRKA